MKKQPYVGLLIAACRRRIKQVVGMRVQRFGLTSQQFWVVMGIAEEPGISLGEVARMRRMDDPTASRIVGALLERGLVRMTPNPRDRRRLRLRLTPAGGALAKKLGRTAREIRRALVRNLSRPEEAELRRLLLKVMDSLDLLAVPPPPGAR
ncbi:MAG: MarR family winged helix-turn-helix transcriptional regulator [Myxococcaceae bacterium]